MSARGPASTAPIAQVRGRGLMLGVVLTEPVAPAVVAAALDLGLLINATSRSALRLVPPLVLTAAQADAALEMLAAAFEVAGRQRAEGSE